MKHIKQEAFSRHQHPEKQYLTSSRCQMMETVPDEVGSGILSQESWTI